MNFYTAAQPFGLSSTSIGASTVAASCPFFDRATIGRKGAVHDYQSWLDDWMVKGRWFGAAWRAAVFIEGKGLEETFMVTGIDIPSSGCWEIGAQYVDDTREAHTLAYLAYIVWASTPRLS